MKKNILLGMLIINTLCISAQDNNTKWRPEITCTEVCGVRFGSSYETAKEILKRKYGEPDYMGTNENTIVYHYKSPLIFNVMIL